MGTISSPVFTGSSSFASDFQASITRAVGFASLPITQMKNDLNDLQGQSDALTGSSTITGIDPLFSTLQSAVRGLDDAMSGASFQADVSNTSAVTATLSAGAQEGVYTIDVQNVGAYAKSITGSNWVAPANPVGQTHTFQLWIGDKSNPRNEIDITPADNSLQSVVAAINAKAGNKVRATVLSVGSATNPDNRISLQATALGDTPVELVDPTRSLQTQQTPGDSNTVATSQSASTWVSRPNPTGQTHTYQLWIGDKSNPANEIDITPADNSADSVAAAINANTQASAKVVATVVNLGTATQPDNRIQLAAVANGAISLDIVDPSLQDQQTTGALAQYVVGDSGKVVTGTSRTVSISTGLTVTMNAGDSGTAVNITVSRSTSAVSAALTTLTTAYNAAVDALDAQKGQTAGALGGQIIVNDLKQSLSGLVTYSDSASSLGGLSALGLTLNSDNSGHVTFNQFNLMAADLSDSTGVTSFLGTATTGGFLKYATGIMTSLEDPTSGLIKTTEADLKTQIDKTNTTMSDKQAQVDALQQTLTAQMAAADAAISSMQQQYSFLSNMFQAMQTANQQYK